MVLVILAVVWALYLISWFRSHAEGRRRSHNSIASFSKHLSVLERTRPNEVGAPARAGRPQAISTTPVPAAASTVTALASARDRRVDRTPVTPNPAAAPIGAPVAPGRDDWMPRSATEAQRRRREVLFLLSGLNLLGLAAALALGGVGYVVLIVAVALLGGYLYLLARLHALETERLDKVRFLHVDDDFFDDEPALLSGT